MSWLGDLWNRWLRGGAVDPPSTAGTESGEDRILTTPEPAEQTAVVPQDQHDSLLDGGHVAESDTS